MKILIAEDDPALGKFLRKALEGESYCVDLAVTGDKAQDLADQVDYDLLLLDVMLPQRSGFDILEHVRRRKSSVPVLMLTANGRTEDRVRGLDLGADDYLSKPFSFAELAARIRALTRRGNILPDSSLRVGDLEINRLQHRVTRAGRTIELTAKEYALLEYLVTNSGRCVTRAMIIDHVWNLSFDTSTNVVDVYINYLRKKIDTGFGERLIHTVRGCGYQLVASSAAETADCSRAS